MDPARPTGSLLVLKALAALEGSGLFDRLDPNTDSQEFRSLRLTCAELQQLVDCFGTKTMHIRLLDSDHPHDTCIEGMHPDCAQLREAGAALGRYHARLTGPVRPRKLCINASTCRTYPACDEHGGGGVGVSGQDVDGADQMAAYMAGYMSVAGVPAVLARVTECHLASCARRKQPAGGTYHGPVQSGMWCALAPHLSSLSHLSLCFNGGVQTPLPDARLLRMLPPSAQLRALSIEEGECVDLDREECIYFLRRAADALKEHPIQELALRLTSRADLLGSVVLHTLSRALPSLERLRITQLKHDGEMPDVHFRWLLPDNTFPILRSINYQPYGNAPRPAILLRELDALLRDRPRLVHVGALDVLLTATCLVKQARYEHVERAQSASAADGGLGQLSFSLYLDDRKAAWGGMQVQALPFTACGGDGQCSASAWSSSGTHYARAHRGMERALAALVALLQPIRPPLPCTQKRTPLDDFLLLTYL